MEVMTVIARRKFSCALWTTHSEEAHPRGDKVQVFHFTAGRFENTVEMHCTSQTSTRFYFKK